MLILFNLNFFLFFFKRWTNLKITDNIYTSANFTLTSSNYPLIFKPDLVKTSKSLYVALCNKIYIFKFWKDLSFSTDFNKYAMYYYYFKKHVNTSADNVYKICNTQSKYKYRVQIKNYKKNLIYKIKEERLWFYKFFFLKSTRQLTHHIKKIKNLNMHYLIPEFKINIYSFCLTNNLCYNFFSYKKIIEKNILYCNGVLITNMYYIIEKNSVINFFLTNHDFVNFFIIIFSTFHFFKKSLYDVKVSVEKKKKKKLFK